MIDSFEISLEAERKSPKTVRTYTEAARWLAGAHLLPAGMTDWEAVTARDVQRWIIAAYSDTYANNQFRALQQFFKWLSAEDPERPLPNPMAGLKPPKVDEKLVPVLAAAGCWAPQGRRVGPPTGSPSWPGGRAASAARPGTGKGGGTSSSATTPPRRSTATCASAPGTGWQAGPRCGWAAGAAAR